MFFTAALLVQSFNGKCRC